MNDPKRLSEELSDAPLEAELLRSARKVGLAETEKRAIWSSLASEVALAALPSAAAEAGKANIAGPAAANAGAAHAGVAQVGTSTASALGLGKALAITALAFALGGGGYALLRPLPRAESPRKGSAASTPVAPAAEIPAAASEPRLDHETTPAIERDVVTPPAVPSANGGARRSASAARSTSAAAPTPASLLREESLGILAARQSLRSGDFTATLQRLEEVRVRFPHGALAQEREALTIETLGRSGARAAAEKRARAFLQAYPKSPYAADVERYAKP